MRTIDIREECFVITEQYLSWKYKTIEIKWRDVVGFKVRNNYAFFELASYSSNYTPLLGNVIYLSDGNSYSLPDHHTIKGEGVEKYEKSTLDSFTGKDAFGKIIKDRCYNLNENISNWSDWRILSIAIVVVPFFVIYMNDNVVMVLIVFMLSFIAGIIWNEISRKRYIHEVLRDNY